MTIGLLLAKSWAIGGALTGLAVFLGLLAVSVPSMRKAVKRKQ